MNLTKKLVAVLLFTATAWAQKVASTNAQGPNGSMIGYNSTVPNWLYLPVDANGYLLVDCPGCTGGGTPGGSTTQGQFNNAGAFGGSSALLFNASTGLIKIIDGQSQTCGYAGSTLDVRLANATADAIAKTNGNTTGIVDASCEPGNQNFPATLTFGDSGEDSVGYIVPCGVYWTGSMTGSPVAIWYSGSTITSVCGSSGNQMKLTDSSTSNPTYIMELIGGGNAPYVNANGFQIENTGGGAHATSSGIGFYITGGFADGTRLSQVNVYDANDAIAEEVHGACCQFTQLNSSINAGFGGIPLEVLTDSASGANYTEDFSYAYGTIVHPGTGHPAVYCYDTRGSTVSSLHINDVYTETGNNSNPTALYLVNGCTHVTISHVTLAQYGTTGFPGVYITNAYPSFVEVSDVWMPYGQAPWTYPAVAVVNQNFLNSDGSYQTLRTDSNGYFDHYSTPTAPTVEPGAQVPFDLPYAGTSLTASRVPGNTTLTDEVLVSHGTTATPAPNTSTCTNYSPSSETVTCTFSAAIPAGSFVAVGLWAVNGPPTLFTVTDSASNSYTAAAAIHAATTVSSVYTQVFYFGPLAAPITTITAVANAGTSILMEADATTNIATSSPVDGSLCYADTTSSTTPTCGSALTTTAANDYIFCDAHNSTVGDTFTAGSAFTAGSSYSANHLSQYKVQSAIGAITPAIASSGASPATMTCAAFKAGSVANAPTLTNAPAISLANATALPPGAAPLASPTFTGIPAVPTASTGTNTTQAASTAFVLANSARLAISSTITSATAGSGISAVTCTTATCTNLRGTYTMTATTVSAGATILTLVWPTTTTAYACLVSQDGGTLAIAPSHSVATATGMTISTDLAITSGSIGVDYSCQP